MSSTSLETQSASEKAMEQLKDYIQNSDHQIGDKLPTERELCLMLGVSRSTVREALKSLQTMGYITIVHGKGAFLKSPTPTSENAEEWLRNNAYALDEIYAIRDAIEPVAASLAAKNATPEEIKELNSVYLKMEYMLMYSIGFVDVGKLADVEADFHTVMVRCTHNRMMINLYKEVTASLVPLRRNNFAILANQRNALAHHKRIMDAIAIHDEALAVEAMKAHMRESRLDMMAIREKKAPTENKTE